MLSEIIIADTFNVLNAKDNYFNYLELVSIQAASI